MNYYEAVRRCDGCGSPYRPTSTALKRGGSRYCSGGCNSKHTAANEVFSNGTHVETAGDPSKRIAIKTKRGGLIYYEPLRPCDFCGKSYRPNSNMWRKGAVRFCSTACASHSIYEENRRDMKAFEKRRALAKDCRQYIQLAMKGRISDEACFRLNGWTPKQLISHLAEDLKRRHPKANIRHWGKRGHKYHLEVDHIRPVSLFIKDNLDTPLSVINALSNLQLLLKADNNRKKARFDQSSHLMPNKFWITLVSPAP